MFIVFVYYKKFSRRLVRKLLDWIRGEAAEVAEKLGVNRYAKRVVFEEFVTAWILVGAHSGSGLREHARQFAAAHHPVSPSSLSHRLNGWRNLVPALLKVLSRMVKRARKAARSRFHSTTSRVVGKLAVFDTSWLTFSSKLVAWALPGSGGAKHRSFVKLLVRTTMSADGDGTVEHVAVRWDTRSFDDNAFLGEATSVKERDVTFIADEGFNALSRLKEVVEAGNHFIVPYHGYAVSGAERLKLNPEDKEYGVTEDVVCVLGAEDNPGRMVARVVTATVACRGGRQTLKLVTDRLDLPARVIPELYGLRWSVEVLFRLLKRGGFDLEKPSARSPQGVVAHVLLVVLAFLLAVLASAAGGEGFSIRHPSVLEFVSWSRVHGGALLYHIFRPRT